MSHQELLSFKAVVLLHLYKRRHLALSAKMNQDTQLWKNAKTLLLKVTM